MLDGTVVVQLLGFSLAAYAIVANDAIQTLGTFLSSNAHRPWWLLWIYACSILVLVLAFGWVQHGGDVSYGRLDEIPEPKTFTWLYVLPPLALLVLTRQGLPVSTTFLILTFFAPSRLGDMLVKSVAGYVVAFIAAFSLVHFVSGRLEQRFASSSMAPVSPRWVLLQWVSTGWLWSQWLIQDLANVYVYLPRHLSGGHLALSLLGMLGLVGITFYFRGGRIQKIVTAKTNTSDIRAASLIDLVFGTVLLLFKELSKIPMSTTWVFLGVLAGREVALALRMKHREPGKVRIDLGGDLGKAAVGLAVSALLAFGLPSFEGTSEAKTSSLPTR